MGLDFLIHIVIRKTNLFSLYNTLSCHSIRSRLHCTRYFPTFLSLTCNYLFSVNSSDLMFSYYSYIVYHLPRLRCTIGISATSSAPLTFSPNLGLYSAIRFSNSLEFNSFCSAASIFKSLSFNSNIINLTS